MPVSGSYSVATSSTSSCHGISPGSPYSSMILATRAARFGRSGRRGVANLGEQSVDRVVCVSTSVTDRLQDIPVLLHQRRRPAGRMHLAAVATDHRAPVHVGSQRVAEVIRALGSNLDLAAVAGVGLAGVLGGRLLQSMLGAIGASIAENAASVQKLRTTAALTEASLAQATAQVAAARAMNMGLGSATALAAAESRLVQAQTARTAAQAALTAATSAGGAATALASGAVSLLGGPLGVVLGLLSAGAAAWALWGGSSEKAAESAASAGESIGATIARLQEEVSLLQKRNALKAAGEATFANLGDADFKRLLAQREVVNDIAASIQRARAAGSPVGSLLVDEVTQRENLKLLESLILAKERGRAAERGEADQDKRLKWLGQMGDKAVQLQQELKKAKEEFGGVIPTDVEKAIRKKFAEPVKDTVAEIIKAGVKLQADLTAEGGGLAGDFAEKWDSLTAAYRAHKISTEQLTRAQAVLLAQQPAIKEATEAEAKAVQAAREELEKQYASAVKSAEQAAAQAADRAAALQLEEDALLLSSAANMTLAEAIERVQIARLREEASKARSAGEQERLDAINAEIAAREKLAKLGVAKELRETGKEAADALKQYLGKDIGTNLAAGFDKASQSLGAFVSGVRDLAVAQADQAQAMRDNLKANGADAAKFAKMQEQITAKGAAQQINAYGNIAGAAKGFFKEGTKGYKALENAEKVFRAFELAMSAKAIAQRLLEVSTVATAKVAGDQLSAQSGAAAAAAEAAASMAKGQAAAAAGVANQAAGDPYTAIPRMAAMAAIMAGLGFMVGAIGGGGGKSDPGNTGTGTVLGDSSAQSKSLTRAAEHLARNSDVSLRYSQGMLAALNTIAAGIGGLSGLIVRDPNLTTGAGFGIETGTKLPGWIGNPLAGGLLGGPIGGVLSLASRIPVVGKVMGSLFGTKTSINGTGLFMGDQSLGSILSDGANLQNYVDVTRQKKFLGVSYSKKSSTAYQDADEGLQRQFGLMFGQLARGVELAAGPLDKSLEEVRARLSTFVVSIGKINLQGLNGDQVKERLTAVFGAAADSIAGAALPGLDAFQKVGEGYFETVVRVASGVESARAVLEQLGVQATAYADIAAKQGDVETELIRDSLLAWEHARHGLTTGVGEIVKNFNGSAAELADVWRSLGVMRDGLRAIGADVSTLGVEMLRGAGGMESLASGLQTYYEKFLTDGERTAELTRRMSERFAAAGLAMPAGSEGFRQLVRAIDTSTASGQALFGRVMALAGGFAELQEALDSADQPARALADRRRELEEQLLQLQGRTAELRARELASIDASLRPLQERIWALQDEQSAAQAAAQAAQAVAQAQQQLASQRAGLEEQLLRLQGNTGALRARELSKLDASLRPLQERIWALEDEQAAAKAAAEASARVAETWRGLGDSIAEEIKRIRGVLTGGAELGLATLQAQFAMDTAAARAGDQQAAQRLPQLSSSLLQAAEASATSAVELKRLQAATAASLEGTLGMIQALGAITPAAGAGASVPAGPRLDYAAPTGSGAQTAARSPLEDLVREVRELRAEVTRLRSEQEASQFAIASHAQRTAKALERVSPAGDALQVRAVP